MRRGSHLSFIGVCMFSGLVYISCQRPTTDTKKAALSHFSSDTALCHALVTKGLTFRQTNDDSLMDYANRALAIATSEGAALEIARAEALKAEGQESKGNYAEAVRLALQAIHLYDSLHSTLLEIRIMNLLSNFYKDMGGEKGTREYLQKGLEISRAANRLAEKEQDPVGMVMGLNSQAIILRDLSRFSGRGDLMDSALRLYEKGIDLIAKSGKGEELLGVLYNNTSQVYNEHYHDYPKALTYLFKAVENNKKRNKQRSLSYNYGNISEVYRQMKDNKNALLYAHEMLDLAIALKAAYRMADAYGQLAIVNKGMKRYDSSLYYTELHGTMSDSLNNLTKTGQIAEMQTKFETQKKEVEIVLLTRANKIKSERLWVALGVLLSLGLLLLQLGLQKRQLQRQKDKITEQSDRLQWLMKELHHRVKNNLQVVSGLLNMQGRRLKDEEGKAAMKESQLRVQAMSLIHQRLYQMEHVTTVNFRYYINDLVNMLLQAYGYQSADVELRINIKKEFLDVDMAMPLALLANEIITNSFKYAYKEVSRPILTIALEETARELVVSISDNGPGLPKNRSAGGFGGKLIDVLARQLKADCRVDGIGGTTYLFTIPLTENSQ
ncbi:MAG TPA: histidine kinase dimerization/phosphoacceptor domain -containing protein [Puia sp.]|nr:histidine kinase dimerization/phosphoacceptor domain -containing protein [Puia sp.]